MIRVPVQPPLLVSHISTPPQCPSVAFCSCRTCSLCPRLFLKASQPAKVTALESLQQFFPSQSHRDFSPFFRPEANFPKLPSAAINLLSQIPWTKWGIGVYLCMFPQCLVSVFSFPHPGYFTVRSAVRRTVSTSEFNKCGLMFGLWSGLKLLCSSVYLALLGGNCRYGCLVFVGMFTWWQCFFLNLIKQWVWYKNKANVVIVYYFCS